MKIYKQSNNALFYKDEIIKLPKKLKGLYFVKHENKIIELSKYIHTHYKPKKEFITQSFNETDYEVLKTSNYPFLKFPFEYFNPLQTLTFDNVFKQDNLLVCAPTASGKTVVAEMFMGVCLALKQKVLYLSPLKSLSDEKLQDWNNPNYIFKNKKISILTGDFQLTANRETELNNADIICMTTEMFDSKTRNILNNDFIKNIGLIIIDEFHLIGVKDRGDKLECSLIKYLTYKPDTKILCLSATFPNANDIKEWFKTISGNNTEIIKSDYRPCKLNFNFCEIKTDNGYFKNIDKTEVENKIRELVSTYENDKFLIFVNSKKQGYEIERKLKNFNFKVAFHNADKNKTERNYIETEFKNPQGKIRILISTTTLAWGVNLPARRVIITGLKIGSVSISSWDIQQMAGRAGRPKFDKQGDVYIFTETGKLDYARNVVCNPEEVYSCMAETDVLKFHLLTEIKNKTITDFESVKTWYSKTLAKAQNLVLNEIKLQELIDKFEKYEMIEIKNGKYKIKFLGIISVNFYFNPDDVNDWKHNFKKLNISGDKFNDGELCNAIGNTHSFNAGYLTYEDKIELKHISRELNLPINPALKTINVLYRMINEMPLGRYSMQGNLIRNDIDRIVSVSKMINQYLGFEEIQKTLDDFSLRLKYNVGKEFVELIRIDGIGKAFAKQLFDNGIKNRKSLLKRENQSIVKSILKNKTENILKNISLNN